MNKKKIGIIALIIVMLSGVMMIFANGIKNKPCLQQDSIDAITDLLVD